MEIAIVGGGNIGTLFAAEFASKGHSVSGLRQDSCTW